MTEETATTTPDTNAAATEAQQEPTVDTSQNTQENPPTPPFQPPADQVGAGIDPNASLASGVGGILADDSQASANPLPEAPVNTTATGDTRMVGRIPRTALIAMIVHEANRLYCRAIGDKSQPHAEDAPQWQVESAMAGVEKIISGEVATARQSHESWLAHKEADGWKYGPTKNAETKEHPCFVPYDELPEEQKVKDIIYFAVVNGLNAAL